jgi:N utilization substance protein B
MMRRSRAREIALQLLFQLDHNPGIPRDAITAFAHARLNNPSAETFCLALYDGFLAHRDAIDEKIAAAAENWRVSRMATVDRNVLRIGAFEIQHTPDTPSNVAIDEAIELARRFGSAESPSFVNGVLDKLLKTPAISA